MPSENHDTFREWLFLEPDGELQPAERSRLEEHVRRCDECRGERAAAARLPELLRASRVEVRKGFADEVMAALPATGWQARHPRSWAASLVLLAVLATGAAATVAAGGGLAEGLPLAAAMGAIVELFRSTALAGAGLLTASWRGIGLALEEALGGSTVSLVVFGVLVLGLDLLFIRFLLRSSRHSSAAAQLARGERPLGSRRSRR